MKGTQAFRMMMMTEQWLTYSEVAEALSIQVQSVRKRRQRYGWQSRTDNQTGRTEVLVDLDAMRKRKPSQPKPEPETPAQPDELVQAKVEIATLEERNRNLEERVSEQQGRIEKLEASQAEMTDRLINILEKEATQPRTGFLGRLLGR
jgi:chromosome segregation ATPase